MNLYKTSDGKAVNQKAIDRLYSKSLKEKHAGKTFHICEGCGAVAEHNDHTISRARCKELHKTELIWDPANYVSSCAQCHEDWENYKSGKYLNHNNVNERMSFLFKNDLATYQKRIYK